jgi:hypothetical protein
MTINIDQLHRILIKKKEKQTEPENSKTKLARSASAQSWDCLPQQGCVMPQPVQSTCVASAQPPAHIPNLPCPESPPPHFPAVLFLPPLRPKPEELSLMSLLLPPTVAGQQILWTSLQNIPGVPSATSWSKPRLHLSGF